MQINEFLQKFDNIKQLKEAQWCASCPVLHNHAHGDQKQSLHIDYKNDKILIHCKVGCDTKEILESIGMSFKDLYTADNYTKDIKTHAEDWLSERGVFSHRIKQIPNYKIGYYQKSNGEYSYKVPAIAFLYYNGLCHNISLYKVGEKKLENWYPKDQKSTQPAVWGLVHNNKSEYLYVCEGEKDALSMVAVGFNAISSSSVSGFNKLDLEYIQNNYINNYTKTIRLCCDNDLAGQKGNERLYGQLYKIFPNLQYEYLLFPDNFPEKGDITDISKIFYDRNGLDGLNGFINFIENKNNWQNMAYKTKNNDITGNIVHLDTSKPNNTAKLDAYSLALPLFDKFRFAINTNFQLSIYKTDEGYWELGSEEYALRTIAKHYRDLPSQKIKNIYEELKLKSETFEHIKVLKQPFIPFRNGVYDLNNNTFRPAESGEIILSPVHTWKPELANLQPVEYDQVLQDWFPEMDANDYEYIISVFAYYCFVPHKDFQIWFNLFGNGMNGKSMLMEILARVIGKQKVASTNFANWGRFTTSDFVGKTHIMAPDSAEYLDETTTLKTITGDSSISVEPKGGRSYNYENIWKVMASTNRLIRSKDKTHGWYRRIRFIPFKVTFEKDPNIWNRLEGQEFEQFVFLLAKYAHRVYKNGDLPQEPKWCREVRNEAVYSDNPVQSWWDELDPKPDNWKINDAYIDYNSWYQSNFGHEATLKINTFGGAGGRLMAVASPDDYVFVRKGDGKYIERRK